MGCCGLAVGFLARRCRKRHERVPTCRIDPRQTATERGAAFHGGEVFPEIVGQRIVPQASRNTRLTGTRPSD
jgi:hypothetical protein